MKYWIVILVCFTLSGCFTKWETKDKLLFASYAGLTAVDTAQSWGIWDDPERRELNPLITSQEGFITIKILGTGAIYLLADSFEDQRTMILTIGNVLIGGAVVWNFSQ